MKATLEERFWAKVDKRGVCWLWTGARRGGGYGNFRYSKPRNIFPHRFAYELLIGPIPQGLTIDHLCRNPACVNPVHLEVVPLRVNIHRGDSFAAQNARKTHCIHGHPFDEANTYVAPDNANRYGQRTCRTCNRACCKARYAKMREGKRELPTLA